MYIHITYQDRGDVVIYLTFSKRYFRCFYLCVQIKCPLSVDFCTFFLYLLFGFFFIHLCVFSFGLFSILASYFDYAPGPFKTIIEIRIGGGNRQYFMLWLLVLLLDGRTFRGVITTHFIWFNF